MKPFPFEKIPKVDFHRDETQSLLKRLPARSVFFSNIRKTIEKTVSRDLAAPFSCAAEPVSLVSLPETMETLPGQGHYLTFTLMPSGDKAVFEIDPLLAHAAVDKLLGGDGSPPTAIRPLSDIEEGVLTFLFLKIFSALFETTSSEIPWHFRIQNLTTSPEEWMPFLEASASEDDDRILLLTLNLSLEGKNGYGRLFLPLSLVQTLVGPPKEEKKPVIQEMSDVEKLQKLGFLKTSLWSELGRVSLKVADINALEVGDVVVLADTGARVQAGRLAGQMCLRVGLGEQGSFLTEIVPDHASLKVKILRTDREYKESYGQE